jgi:AcrR family transcriptional regulator
MSDKPLRADARRNRERVLAAAQEAFAAEGLAVPLDEIARRAGVGAGTVYRHFPTKEALFEAAIVDRTERMLARAHALADSDDPGAAFFDFLTRLTTDAAVKRDLADAVGVGMQDTSRFAGLGRRVNEAVGVLLDRAQAAGAVRADIVVTDLILILKSCFLAGSTAGVDPETGKRVFAVVFDGLRRC